MPSFTKAKEYLSKENREARKLASAEAAAQTSENNSRQMLYIVGGVVATVGALAYMVTRSVQAVADVFDNEETTEEDL